MRATVLVPAALAVGVLWLFGDVLRPGVTAVPAGSDIEIHGRLYDFAARHLAAGRVPRWNPHVFSGMPALGDPNAMMLYPPTLLSVVLPLPRAVTVIIVLHVLLAGVFTYAWAARRGLHPAGCLLAGAMVAFGGQMFGRIQAGHLSALAAMAWAPLVLLATDELLRRPALGWLALGAVAVAMQVLGGHPQYVFYSLLAAGGTLVLGVARAPRPLAAAGAFGAMVVAGLALAGAQLLPMLDAFPETVRGGGAMAKGAAATFSLTWSSLIMLLVPGFFGTGSGEAYWGDWLFWEMTPYVGAVGLVAALHGVAGGDRAARRGAGILAAGFLLLALGDRTPLFGLLYDFVPPFDRLRASARALYFSGLFTAMLAAAGTDALVRRRARRTVSVAALLVLALALGLCAAWIRSAPSPDAPAAAAEVLAALRLRPPARDQRLRELAAGDGVREGRLRVAAQMRDAAVAATDPVVQREATRAYEPFYVMALGVDPWQRLRAFLVSTPGFSSSLERWADPAAGREQALVAAQGVLVAAAEVAAGALFLFLASRTAAAAVGLSVLGTLELVSFAASVRVTSDQLLHTPPSLAAFHAALPRDVRTHHMTIRNSSLSVGAYDVWGYDPFVLARYSRYFAFTQGLDPKTAPEAIRLGVGHRSHAMLRLQLVLAHDGPDVAVVAGPDRLPPPLPRALLVRRYVVQPEPGYLFAVLNDPHWDPRQTVVLESEPTPAPDPAGQDGTVRIRDESTDHLTIAADLPSAAILLVTDAYSRRWRARSLTDPEREWPVMPANGVLRAVPLPAGSHTIRMEFAPAGLRAGVALSLAALLGLLLIAGRSAARRLSRRSLSPHPPV